MADEKKPKEKEAAAAGKDKDAKKAPDKPAEAAAAAPAKSNPMVFFGMVGAAIVLNIVLAVVLVRMTTPKPVAEPDAKHAEDTTKKHGEDATLMGETTAEAPIEILVNIAGTDGERFLKAAVVLEFEEHGPKVEKKEGGHGGGHGGGAAASPLATAILQRMPKYKSYLIENLAKMTLSEITTPDAKEKIRKDMLRMVNGTLPPDLGVVKDIYFTQFIIQ
ncbi:MAG: flagellar basal body-associated FliL family protein [Chitinispirillaceae bacterium]|jgi:flagellar basal body-associated protein FliL|nr:flagellar basal body-associated FliL family protein [Chitinispirillaceae bacterium]